MKIIETKREISNAERYALTIAPNIQKMRVLEGQTIDVSLYCFFEDEDKEGNKQELISIMTLENEVYATNSKTFIDSFRKIVECFGSDGFEKITVGSGVSKAGRTYITAIYAE